MTHHLLLRIRQGLLLALVLIAGLAQSSTSVHAQNAYADQAVLAADPAFVARVKIAAVQYAINNVSVETDDVVSHAQRLTFALRVVADPARAAALLSVGVVADLTFTANTSDAAIFSRVGFVWNTYAAASW